MGESSHSKIYNRRFTAGVHEIYDKPPPIITIAHNYEIFSDKDAY
jgi:hypothetical protein